jgi:hypothetical protein
MNNLIRQFERESHIDVYGLGLDRDKWEAVLEKFAELIVAECLGIINKEHDEGIDRHGDYQLALYEAYREIKQHFGVEE